MAAGALHLQHKTLSGRFRRSVENRNDQIRPKPSRSPFAVLRLDGRVFACLGHVRGLEVVERCERTGRVRIPNEHELELRRADLVLGKHDFRILAEA